MKKLLLASAVAALSVSAAHAAPTVYGKAFLLVDYQDYDDESETKLNSKSSRIGVKGSEALTANTDVIYKLEYEVDIDEEEDQFTARDTYLGLKNAQYGTFLAGRLTTIDDYVDFADVLEGKNIAKKAAPSFDEPRVDNAFAYMSPDYDGLQVLAMYALDTDQDSTGNSDNADHDQYGLGATYTTGPMNLGASYIVSADGDQDFGFGRISGNYQVSPQLVIGAMYQNGDYDTDDNENAFVLSAEMDTGTKWTTYGQINKVDNKEGVEDLEELGVGIGGRYKFTKAATGHIYAGYRDTDDGDDSVDGFGIGTGLEYKF